MAETLFGYSVEDDGGTLVISVRGLLADQAVRQMRERLERGSAPVGALLSPLVPIGRLLSGPVELRSERARTASPQIDETALQQQVEQTFSAFSEPMEEFREALRQVAKEPGGGKGAASAA
jgi:hypothetical protein